MKSDRARRRFGATGARVPRIGLGTWEIEQAPRDMGDRARGTVKVDVEILDPDEKLFPELVATVHFLPDKNVDNPNAGKTFLFVPKAAIVDEGGHSHVWIVQNDGSVHKQRVAVVVTNDDLARVEEGLAAGAKVVLNPDSSLQEGLAVEAER